jgi:hypothetical protein
MCEWVERDLLFLQRVDTTVNMADHFTKQPGTTLFHQHVDYNFMGHVPPHYTVHFQKLLVCHRSHLLIKFHIQLLQQNFANLDRNNSSPH